MNIFNDSLPLFFLLISFNKLYKTKLMLLKCNNIYKVIGTTHLKNCLGVGFESSCIYHTLSLKNYKISDENSNLIVLVIYSFVSQ